MKKDNRAQRKPIDKGQNAKTSNSPNDTKHTEETKNGLWKRVGQWRLPSLLVFTVGMWLWAWLYYGSVFAVSEEYSFWSWDVRLLSHFMSQPYAPLRYVGRALLTLFHYPALGSALLALMGGMVSAMVGYLLMLPARWRWVQYLPVVAYMLVVTHLGIDVYYEAETGYIMGVPALVLGVLAVVTLLVRILSHRPLPLLWRVPADEGRTANWCQTVACVMALCAVVAYDQWKRPYVRTISRMVVSHWQQDWDEVQRVARANAEQSNRIMATYYAAALVHTGRIGTNVYDIRLEYDTLSIHGMDLRDNTGINMYLEEGNFHAGLMQTCYHSCMEQMVMTGPTLRLLKLMTKCALIRTEWELARKYLYILSKVPFQEDFCRRYGAMVRNYDLMMKDAELAKVAELQPIQDSFENQHQNPTFMGYNLNLSMGRSMAAWDNSTAVCLYTKLLPQFTSRLEPYVGKTLPENFADGALLAARKYPEILDAFPQLKWRSTQLESYINSMQPYMSDRPGYGPKLFPSQKGYYPHYYFFGNLRATKAGYTGESVLKKGGGVN